MDPTATLELILANLGQGDRMEGLEALNNLLEWIERGGEGPRRIRILEEILAEEAR